MDLSRAFPGGCGIIRSTRRGRFEHGDVVGRARREDGPVVVDVVDVHGHREVRHALLQPFVKLRRDLSRETCARASYPVPAPAGEAELNGGRRRGLVHQILKIITAAPIRREERKDGLTDGRQT